MNPFFSILIPTKNRAFLLSQALESIKNQKFSNFEVIISNDHSTDNTEEIIKKFNDERFKLVSPDKELSMSEHYEFVSNFAKGEYICYFPDRSLAYSFFLEDLNKIIKKTKAKLIGWNNDKYDDSNDNNRKYYYHLRSNKIIEYSNKYLLNLHYNYALQEINYSPASPASSCCHKSVVEEVRKYGTGRLVYDLIPDVTYSVQVLANVEKFIYYDKSLTIGSGYSESVGNNFSKKYNDSYKKIVGKTGEICQRVPCKNLFVNSNLVADDLLMLKEIYSNKLKNYNINYEKYFLKVMKEIINLDKNNINTTKQWKIWKEAINLSKIKNKDELTIKYKNMKKKKSFIFQIKNNVFLRTILGKKSKKKKNNIKQNIKNNNVIIENLKNETGIEAVKYIEKNIIKK